MNNMAADLVLALKLLRQARETTSTMPLSWQGRAQDLLRKYPNLQTDQCTAQYKDGTSTLYCVRDEHADDVKHVDRHGKWNSAAEIK